MYIICYENAYLRLGTPGFTIKIGNKTVGLWLFEQAAHEVHLLTGTAGEHELLSYGKTRGDRGISISRTGIVRLIALSHARLVL